MGKTRGFYYSIDNINKVEDFGTYALAMYYVKQINASKGKKLLEATLSEAAYRFENELPSGGLDGLEDFEAHYVRSDLQEVIFFIENDLIPALNNETQNLLVKYGGRANFVDLYYTNPDYLIALGVDDDEFYMADPSSIAAFLLDLKDVFEYSLSVNKPCEVLVY